METLRPFLDQVMAVWKDSTAAARLGIILLALLCAVAIIGIGIWSATPEYVRLPIDIPEAKFLEYVKELDSEGISYRRTGNQLEVDRTKQLEATAVASSMGLSNREGEPEYDVGGFWPDPDMRNTQNLRNKEKQLRYMLRRIKQIDDATVVLHIPPRQPFARRSTESKASVLLNVSPGLSLDDETAANIASLVANAVAGLNSSQVQVSDQFGNHYLTDDSVRSVQSNEKHRILQERYLENKAQEILDKFVGIGNATVKVNLDLDFKQQEINRIDYDNAGKVKATESITTSNTTNGKGQAAGPAGTSSNANSDSLTSFGSTMDQKSETIDSQFKVPETQTVVREFSPVIKSMTAAVLVNSEGLADDQGQVAPEIQQEFTNLVSKAIGLNEQRGDQIAVNFSKFKGGLEFDETVAEPIPWDQIHQVLKNISLGLAGLVALLVGIMAIRKIAPPNRPGGDVAVNRGSQIEQLKDLVKENPEVFSQIIAAWSNSIPDVDADETEPAVRRVA